MRTALLMMVLSGAGHGAVLTVCPGGPGQAPCETPAQTRAQLQSAIDQAEPGDEIELAPGDYQIDSTVILKKKPGAEWITIRTSRAAELPPEGYRVNESHAALMPRIWTTRLVSIFETQQEFPLRKGLADEPFSIVSRGNTIIIGGGCSEAAPCRARTRNGTMLTLTAPVGAVTLESAPVSSGEIRIGLNNEGKLTVKKKADLVQGAHFTCTNCAPAENYDIANWSFEYASDSIAIAVAAYSAAGWTRLSSGRTWVIGPCVNDSACPGLFDGPPENLYAGPAAGSHHYRFLGIHFTQPDFRYYLLALGIAGVHDWRDMPHHLEIDRCLFSGRRNARGPGAGIGVWAEEVTIKNSSFLWFTRHDSDGQQILVHSACPGPVIIENNSLDGAVENFLAGGTGSPVAAYVPVVRFRRNYVWKRLDYWVNVAAVRSAPNVLRFRSGLGQNCDVAKGLDECFYHRDEVRRTLTEDSYATVNAPVTGTLYSYIDAGGRYVLGHPWTEAEVTCSGQLACAPGVTAVPAEANLQYAWNVKNGELDTAAAVRKPFQKNLWECKNCKNTVVEGNVFRNIWKDAQTSAFALTPRNQYGHETWVRMDDVLFERNLLVGAASLMGVTGVDDMGGNTYTRALRFRHNVFADVDEARWSTTTNGFGGGVLLNGRDLEIEMVHNTAQLSDSQGYCEGRVNRVVYRDNLFLWKGPGDFTSRGIAYGFNNALKAGFVTADSVYSHNVNLSGGGQNIAAYPEENWGEKANPADHLVKLSNPAALGDNFRLLPDSRWSAACTLGCAGPSAGDGSRLTSDGLDPGADIDWVETLTDGVVEGLPELSVRWDLQIEPGAKGAVFRYRPAPEAACTLKVATHQSMRPEFLVQDTSAEERQRDSREGNAVQDGRRTFNVGQYAPLEPGGSYWYLLSCGGKAVKGQFRTAAESGAEQ